LIYHPPKHWITAFKVGSNWLLRDDDDTYAFYDGFENEKLKKIRLLILINEYLNKYG
jgi:hypothetical protein